MVRKAKVSPAVETQESGAPAAPVAPVLPPVMLDQTDPAERNFKARVSMLESHNLRHGAGGDIDSILKGTGKFGFTLPISAAIDRMGIDTGALFAPTINPKVAKRFVQFIGGIVEGNYKHIDRVTATIIYALQMTDKPLTVDALHYIGAGLKAGKIAPETRGVSKRAAMRLFGAVGLSTIPTQTSRTVGKNGFLQLTGATHGDGKQNQSVTINVAHPLIVAFNDCMNKATDAQLDAMMGEEA